MPPAIEVQSLNLWSATEVPESSSSFFFLNVILFKSAFISVQK